MPNDLEIALLAAAAAAATIRSFDGLAIETSFKGVVDPVTEVDEAAEQAIRQVVGQHRPDDHILGEESGGTRGDGRVWIVDPLDGTVNFIHGIPHFAVSVALWDGPNPLVAVVHDPCRDEVFSAERGRGAWLDDRPISVSSVADVAKAIVVTGFPYDRQERAGAYSEVVGRVMAEVMGIRRLGSAALDLAWVACGRFDGYWEPSLGPWDAAAGILLVEEAGGSVSGYGGKPHNMGKEGLIVSNATLHQTLVDAVGVHP